MARRVRQQPEDPDAPVYSIARAAELSDMHPQTLRQYDRIGLVVPKRTAGGVRRYSLNEVMQLSEIRELSNEGVGLNGITRVVELTKRVHELSKYVHRLERELEQTRSINLGRQVFAARESGEVIRLVGRRRVSRRTELVLWRPSSSAMDETD